MVRFHQGYMCERQRTVPYLGVAQLVARLLWEQDVGSSSLPTQTIINHKRRKVICQLVILLLLKMVILQQVENSFYYVRVILEWPLMLEMSLCLCQLLQSLSLTHIIRSHTRMPSRSLKRRRRSLSTRPNCACGQSMKRKSNVQEKLLLK